MVPVSYSQCRVVIKEQPRAKALRSWSAVAAGPFGCAQDMAEAQRFHLKRGAAVATARASVRGAQRAKVAAYVRVPGRSSYERPMGGCTLVTSLVLSS